MYFSDNFLRRTLRGVKTCEKREKHKNTKVKAQSPGKMIAIGGGGGGGGANPIPRGGEAIAPPPVI